MNVWKLVVKHILFKQINILNVTNEVDAPRTEINFLNIQFTQCV